MITFLCQECDEEMEIADRMAGRGTRCVGCGARIIVPDRISRRQDRSQPSGTRGSSRRRAADLWNVALYQRLALLCLLANTLAWIVCFVTPAGFQLAPLLLILLSGTATTVFIFLLSLQVYAAGVGVTLGVFSLVPIVGLIIVLAVNQKAIAVLQKHGYRVGFLGVDMSQFAEQNEDE